MLFKKKDIRQELQFSGLNYSIVVRSNFDIDLDSLGDYALSLISMFKDIEEDKLKLGTNSK